MLQLMSGPSRDDLSKAIAENPDGKHEEKYTRILEAEDYEWDALDTNRYLQLLGLLYNLSDQKSDCDGLDRVINLGGRLEDRELDPAENARRCYQLANAHSLRHSLSENRTQSFTLFDSKDLIEAIGYSRASLTTDGLRHLPNERISTSLVNFANLLSQTGRVTEALRYYNDAVKVVPTGMALGNRGQCKMEYGSLLFNSRHTEIFLHSAYEDLKKALEQSDELYSSAEKTFQHLKNGLEEFSDEQFSIEAEDEYELGETEGEVEYKKWVLENHLFLNPLNDVSTHSVVAHDFFHLPNMMIPEDDDFPYPGIYNQLKQEFVSARYLYYEGVSSDDSHFSDKGVELPDTLDYPVFGYHTEQIKTSLRLSYSIFDKIAGLLNHYYDLGHDEVKFSNFWYPNASYSNNLHKKFEDTDNWALNALYWLKKDFHHSISKRDDESGVVVAHELKSIRDSVEHNYLKVFNDDIVSEPPSRDGVYKDSIYDSIGKNELGDSAMEMLRLARAGLFYTSFTIYLEEQQRDVDGITVPMPSYSVPDHLKE